MKTTNQISMSENHSSFSLYTKLSYELERERSKMRQSDQAPVISMFSEFKIPKV